MEKVPRYGVVRELSKEYLKRTERPDRREHPEQYEGYQGALIFLRYYNLHRRRFEEDSNKNISTSSVRRKIEGEAIEDKIKLPRVSYDDMMKVRREIGQVDESYNTPDGQMRWLLDHDLGKVELKNFWRLVPAEVRSRMTNWRQMNMLPEKAMEIRSALGAIDDSYNTRDGHIRWMQDNGLTGTNVGIFRRMIPKEVKIRMTEWHFDGRVSTSFEEGAKFYSLQEGVIRLLRDKYELDDPVAELKIINFVARAQLTGEEINAALKEHLRMRTI